MIAKRVKKERLLRMLEDELQVRNYAVKTVKNYCMCVRDFLSFVDSGWDDMMVVKKYLLLKQKQDYSPQSINLYLNAVKFFYRYVLKVKFELDIKFVKRTKRIPMILSRKEIKKIISVILNQKHRLLISLAYGAGLRVSEVVKMRVQDLDFDRGLVLVRSGKGAKDRRTVFPVKLRDEFEEYLEGWDRDDFVFFSNRGGRLCERSAQKVFQNAVLKSGIRKRVSAAQFCNALVGKWGGYSLCTNFARSQRFENNTDLYSSYEIRFEQDF